MRSDAGVAGRLQESSTDGSCSGFARHVPAFAQDSGALKDSTPGNSYRDEDV